MRLERISEFEIKAYLSEDDLSELGIRDASRLDCGAADMILNIAKTELDFLYEKNNCEIFAEARGEGYTLTIVACGSKSSALPHTCVLCFDNEDALKAACEYLMNFSIRQSELRAEENGREKTYYLLIKYGAGEPELDGKPFWLSSVSELCFCSQTDKNAFFYYISEHSAPLLQKNAVFDIAKSEKKW